MADNNKIKYGLKNVYFAIATIGDNGSATYGTPVRFPGAVSLSLDSQGENTPFHADDIVYYVGTSNSGYEGDLEMAIITDAFRKQVLGELTDSNGVMLEDMNAEAVHFALIFEFSHDKHNTRHVLYNCTATRPSVGSTTKEDTIEPQTESVTITATGIYIPAIDRYISKARVPANNATRYNAWFQSVYMPSGISAS